MSINYSPPLLTSLALPPSLIHSFTLTFFTLLCTQTNRSIQSFLILHPILSKPLSFRITLHLLQQLTTRTHSALSVTKTSQLSHMTEADSEHAVPTGATPENSLREQDNRCTAMPSKQASSKSHTHLHSDLVMDPAGWLRAFLKTMTLAAQEEPMFLQTSPEVARNVTKGNVFTFAVVALSTVALLQTKNCPTTLSFLLT